MTEDLSNNQAEGATSPDGQVSSLWERFLQKHEMDRMDTIPDMKLTESWNTFGEYLYNWQIFQYWMDI